MVQHHIITETLEKHIDSGKSLPQNLYELSKLKYTNGNQEEALSWLISNNRDKIHLIYNPSAWDDPSRILLQSSALGKYIVTFGNGTWAVVSRWRYKGHAHQSLEDADFEKGGCRLYTKAYSGLTPLLILFLCLLVSFFVLVIIENIMKKRSNINP